MKSLNRLLAVASAAFFIAGSALAQNAGTVTNHAFALGKGPGVTGYTSLLCGSAQLAVGQSAADPICRTVTGDVTIDASGVTAIGTAKVTNAMLAAMAANTTKCNATAGSASPTDCTASSMRTNIGVVIGTNVEAWDADLDCLAALAGTGIVRRTGAGTCSNGTAVTNAELATMAAFTFKGNNTSGATAPTDVDISLLSSKASPAASDLVMISDQAASGAWKKVTISSLASAGSVSSIAGNTGAFTLSNGIKNATNDIQADPVFHRSYLAGLTLSTSGASATFGIAAGVAVDSTNAGFMSLASAYTKTTSAWAVGSGNGSLDTGSIAASTWYHAFLIKRTDTGVVDVLVSLSATTPTMPTNYTLSRRIGSMKTNGSSQWTGFTQKDDTFLWAVPTLDVNGTAFGVTTAILTTVNVPTGIQVESLFSYTTALGTTTAYNLLTSPDQTDSIPSASLFLSFVISGVPYSFQSVRVRTNTSAQVRERNSQTDSTRYITTTGWVDTRGRSS